MSTIITQTLARLLDPGLRKINDDSMMMVPLEMSQFVNVSTMDEPYFTDYKLAGLGLLPIKPEGQAVTYDSPIPGTTKRYDPIAYGMGFRSTHEAVRDERYGQLKKLSAMLGRAVQQSVNILGSSAFNNAFSTSFVGFNAGESLCSTSHALLGGGTYANRPATNTALSVSGLQAAVIRMEKTLSERGFNIPIKPRVLVIPVDLLYVAKEILKSEKIPYSVENTYNAIKDSGFGFKEWHFLTSATAWFLLGPDHDINMFWREKPSFASGDDFDTGDAKHKVYLSVTTSQFGDWKGIDGNDGTV